MEIECKKCGAVYKIIEHEYPMRDKDFLKCDFCDCIIYNWNGGVFYSSKLISEPTKNLEYLT